MRRVLIHVIGYIYYKYILISSKRTNKTIIQYIQPDTKYKNNDHISRGSGQIAYLFVYNPSMPVQGLEFFHCRNATLFPALLCLLNFPNTFNLDSIW